MPVIQAQLRENDPARLKLKDRVAHQYQIAGGEVLLTIASRLPNDLVGVGLFEPNSEYKGIGRISTGMGCPHAETRPDYLGLRLAFQTGSGARVDFIGINDPASPTDTHTEFMRLLEATAEGAGSGFFPSAVQLLLSLSRSLGPLHGGRIASHVVRQTLRTSISKTAYQTYWTGIVEAGGTAGKIVIEPASSETQLRAFLPSARHLSDEWCQRQRRGPIEFNVYWISFIEDHVTSLAKLTKGWKEHRHPVGRVIFPRCDPETAEAGLWAALAHEMGANPGNWVRDRGNTISQPSTEFEVARKMAYEKSQKGRNVLPEAMYAAVFQTGAIDETLAAELNRRRAEKRALGHIDTAV